jgi:exodeoxyribonuclease V alpha subunit
MSNAVAAAAGVDGELAEWVPYRGSGWGWGAVLTTTGERVPIVGNITGARAGDAISAAGEWRNHARYGRQFVVQRVELRPPQSADGVVLWLADTLPNVGRKRARAMVEHFGGPACFWHTVEHAPERLAEVPGITPDRARDIHTTYLTARADRDHNVRLRGWGLTPGQVARCVEVWVTLEHAVAVITADPYELYRHIHGFGWLTADRIARVSGIPLDSPLRVDTGVVYALDVYLADGHVHMTPGAFQRACIDVLSPVAARVVWLGIQRALSAGRLIKRGPRVYTARGDTIEAALAANIKARATGHE